MRTVAETPVFIRYASEGWTDAERHEFISCIAANPLAGDLPTSFLAEMKKGVEDVD